MVGANSAGGPSGLRSEHRLQSEWAFHYMRRQGSAPRTESYADSIKLLGAPFNTVEAFWQHYQWLKRPTGEENGGGMPNSTDLHIFRSGIEPMWEDDLNRYGGKVVVRVRKGLTARYWEDVCCAIVGEQFGVGDEICGAVLSLRFQEDIISIWNRTATNHEGNARISEVLRRVLNVGPQGVSEYKPHQSSLTGKQGYQSSGAPGSPGLTGTSPGGGPSGGFGQMGGLRSPPLAGGGNPMGRVEGFPGGGLRGPPQPPGGGRAPF